MPKITYKGKQINYDRNNPLSEDIVNSLPIDWQKQYIDYIEGQKDAWFWMPKYAHLRSSKESAETIPVKRKEQIYYTSAEDKAKKDAYRSKLTSSVRESMNNAGNTIGKIGETAVSFSPMWWAVPAARSISNFSNGNVKEGFKEIGKGLLAPYAVGKGIQQGIRGYQWYKGVNKALSEGAMESMANALKPGRVTSDLSTIHLTPEELSAKIDLLNQQGIAVRGHGTGRRQPDPWIFFDQGLKVKEGDLANTSIPLGGNSAQKLKQWPHLNSEDIVLIGTDMKNAVYTPAGYVFPDAFPEGSFETVTIPGSRMYPEQIITRPIGNVLYTSPKATVGVYNSKTGTLTFNPRNKQFTSLYESPRNYLNYFK